jgi:hypothetical protein
MVPGRWTADGAARSLVAGGGVMRPDADTSMEGSDGEFDVDNEHELLAWVHDHRGKLHDISVRLGADERMIQGLALMVLSGYTDAEVYQDLQHELLVWDGQRNPLQPVPEALAEVRRLITEDAGVEDGA